MDDDTPETTHVLHGVWYRGDHGSAIPALCRRLERERNILAEQLRGYDKHLRDCVRWTTRATELELSDEMRQAQLADLKAAESFLLNA